MKIDIIEKLLELPIVPHKNFGPSEVNIRVSFHYYTCFMPCGIKVEVLH